MSPQDIRIGYILKGYPRTSETFITNEIFLLENEGLDLSIFSLKKLEGQKLHGIVSKIKAPVTYLPETTPLAEGSLGDWLWKNAPNFATSLWQLFWLRPRPFLQTLYETIALSLEYREGGFFAAPNRRFFKEFFQAGFIALNVLENGIRHLHAHFCHTSTTVAMLVEKLSGVPFSFTAHAKDIYRSDMNPGDLLQLKMRRAQFVITCTKANRDYLVPFCPEKKRIHTIYHGLDISLFAPYNKPAIGLEQNGKPLILSVGRLVEKKGFIYLLDACRLLKAKGLEFKCLIIGGGDAEETEPITSFIKRFKMEQFVKLKQAVTQEELRGIYRQATLFALPSQIVESGDRDGIPNVLVEAMAMELPVISTDISGIPELIEDRMNGLLVPQKDTNALAQAIEELLGNPHLRRNLGRAARITVCWRFDSKHNVLMIRDLFQVALSAAEVEQS
jgi:glycosyltransferase involved in cell wall biosynthesis